MPDPHSLARALDEQRIRRQVERRVLPYGGDKAVARSIYNAHPPSRWPFIDTCGGCGEKWPCKDRRESGEVLAS
ncbi:MAG: hypothetical protein GEU94_06450 [Micromonosporaceae bacterium]|nr:hypothetical protein [Micromonosporaceae bacterium]